MILLFSRVSDKDCCRALCRIHNRYWHCETLNAQSESGKPLIGKYWIASVPTELVQPNDSATLTRTLYSLKVEGLIPEGKASDYLCINKSGQRYLALPEKRVKQYVRERARLATGQKDAAQAIPEVAIKTEPSAASQHSGFKATEPFADTERMPMGSEDHQPVMLTAAHHRIVRLLDAVTHQCKFQGQPAGWSLCEHSGVFHLLTNDRREATHILRTHGIPHEAHQDGDTAIIEVPFSEALEPKLRALTRTTPDTVVGSVHEPVKLNLPDAGPATIRVDSYLAAG